MFKTVIYHRTLKKIRPDQRFEAIFLSFQNVDLVKKEELRPCDLAVIQGWKKNGSDAPHNVFRQKIIDRQFSLKKHILTVDGNIFDYKSKGTFFRYSIDGIFSDTGYYFDDNIDPNRWKQISKITGCELKPWRKNGEHVLILLQKDSGWTMQNTSNIDVLKNTIAEIRRRTDRKIIVRAHPSDASKVGDYANLCDNLNAEISKKPHITDDLNNAWCSITFNSSPGAVSVIEGIPTFIMDPNWKRSPASAVGNINIKDIEDPIMPSREEWIQKVSMSHFSISDIQKGLLWAAAYEFFKRKELV
jgi:hypothetical protein